MAKINGSVLRSYHEVKCLASTICSKVKKPKHHSIDWFNRLPADLILLIFNYLSFPELHKVQLVCKRWSQITQHPNLMLSLFDQVFHITKQQIKTVISIKFCYQTGGILPDKTINHFGKIIETKNGFNYVSSSLEATDDYDVVVYNRLNHTRQPIAHFNEHESGYYGLYIPLKKLEVSSVRRPLIKGSEKEKELKEKQIKVVKEAIDYINSFKEKQLRKESKSRKKTVIQRLESFLYRYFKRHPTLF